MFEEFIKTIKEYNPEEVEIITKAYKMAEILHSGQKRQSGEPYIVHPLAVASILAEMKADRDTICAALLHDTLEDTNITKEEIAREFNPTVANLVDGVTKITKESVVKEYNKMAAGFISGPELNIMNKEDQDLANTRKIIVGITEDVRIIIIKLADRLHNMRTLQYKSEYKQKENALETMDLFVPLAYYIGAYRIKNELEDLSLRYLKPDEYRRIEEQKLKIEEESNQCLLEMYTKIMEILNAKEIPNEIKMRTKNIYGIYKCLKEGQKLSDIPDLLALKVMVDTIDNCYRTLGLIHSEYHPINNKFKDYICNPKTNMYRSLHTTVFGSNDRIVQTQIRTFDMDKVASFGLTYYWDLKKGDARNVMQEELRQKYQFYKSLTEINAMFSDNKDFVNQVKYELFSTKIYVHASLDVKTEARKFSGDIELPVGSTLIDLAYKINTNVGNTMVAAKVNDEYVSLDHVLENNDIVKIITDDLSFGPKQDWIEKAHTGYAKQKIKEYGIKI